MAVLRNSPPSPIVRPVRRHIRSDTATTAVALLVAERARAGGDAVALLDELGEAVTWRDVAMAAEQWRSRFDEELSSGTPFEVCVGLVLSSPLEFGRQYLAALAAGVPVAPLNAGLSQAELLWATASIGLSHVMSEGGELTQMRQRRRRAGVAPRLAGDFPLSGFEQGLAGGWHPSMTPIAGSPAGLPARRAPAVVITTAGSTGAPKLVPFTQRQLLVAASRAVRHLGLQRGDRAYVSTPLHGVDGQVVGILAPLVSGGSAVLARFHELRYWDTVERSGATWLNLDPAMAAALVDAPPPAPDLRDRVRFARVGGGGLPLQTHARLWLAAGISLLETYTVSEAAGTVAANPVVVADRRPGSVGRPVGVELRIVDSNSQLAPVATPGRIQIRGDCVAYHYLPYGRRGAADSMPARGPNGWFDTGDVGFGTAEGYLYVTGPAGTDEPAGDGYAGCGLASGIRRDLGATERSSQVACGTPASPLRAAAFRP
jgi:oxalate---CoA ligase